MYTKHTKANQPLLSVGLLDWRRTGVLIDNSILSSQCGQVLPQFCLMLYFSHIHSSIRSPAFSPHPSELVLEVSSRSKQGSRMPLAPGVDEGDLEMDRWNVGRGENCERWTVIEGH